MTTPVPTRRRFVTLGCTLGLAGLATLTGCAAMNSVNVTVRTFGAWPEGRAPGRYAFDRLPSQEAAPERRAALEAAASAALERAGFSAAGDAEQADVLVQFGARQAQLIEAPPRVSFGIGIGTPIGRHGGLGWGMNSYPWYTDRIKELREMGLLLIDRRSRKVLVEVQARHESRYGMGDDVLQVLFDAALDGFPDLPAGERTVTVALPGR
ncbi:DUF4136 domain-containing protein [Leptothrix discophora]|uniref:DUF4136 domain-containing protein n=1 Tax=Leptothrix discophora TaxID=89 RepID=A0ABT9G7F8_LEPDI|nr:DUF4136 domain-containing protein [Leptothrix discophora]MDP4302427.1 DUF4136 domain-containing protein [Leptothrix discophora]